MKRSKRMLALAAGAIMLVTAAHPPGAALAAVPATATSAECGRCH